MRRSFLSVCPFRLKDQFSAERRWASKDCPAPERIPPQTREWPTEYVARKPPSPDSPFSLLTFCGAFNDSLADGRLPSLHRGSPFFSALRLQERGHFFQ